ncbi:MAG: ARMT1-like domain-containing protein, partial [Candidatus Caldatribacteriota bacterium]|nr:ARMT1-like domain-containing protein [Candidatus Caldatribacteriota bacterium]
ALETAVLSGADEVKQKEIIDELSKLIPDFPLTASPPEMGRKIYSLIGKISGVKDPYKEIKRNSNKLALKLYPKLKEEIKNSEDRLLTAVKLSIIGNIIDYGAKNSLNVEEEINHLFQGNFTTNNENNPVIFKYKEFKEDLKGINNIIYLADNAGEVVFDRLLIEELVEELDKDIIYVVKDKPVINDALIEDAIYCGINKTAHIISNGSNAPGSILKDCSNEMVELYQNAELIISKGQGNYESLSEEDRPIFFMFRAKCPVIAKHIGCNIGDMVLWADKNKL